MAGTALRGVLIDRFRCVRAAWIPITQGHVTVLIGPNDAGKSTILRAVAAVSDPPDAEDAVAAAFFTDGRTFDLDATLVLGDASGAPDDYQWLWRTEEIEAWSRKHHRSGLRFGATPPEGWGLTSALNASDAAAAALIDAAAASGTFAVSAYGPGRPGTLTRWLAGAPPMPADEPAVDVPWSLRELDDVALGTRWFNAVSQASGTTKRLERLPAEVLQALPPRTQQLEEVALLEDGVPLGEVLRRRASLYPALRERLALPLGTDIPAGGLFVQTPTRGADLEAFLARRLSALVSQWGAPPIPSRPWYVRSSDSRGQEPNEDLLAWLAIVGDTATGLLPPFAHAQDGPPTTIRIDIEEQEEVGVYASRRGRPAVRLDSLAEGFRLWIGLAVLVAAHRDLQPAQAAYPPAACRALDDAAYDIDRSTLTVLMDEPERHLHPHVQRGAARWLAEFARREQLAVVIATHAAPFLAMPNALFVDVARPEDETRVRRIDPHDLAHQRDVAARLGFDRGELSELVNLALLVEGAHEEIVLEAWFAAELRQAGILVLPIRGTNNVGAATLALEALLRFMALGVGFLFDADPEIQRLVALAGALSVAPQQQRAEIIRTSGVSPRLLRRKKPFVDLITYGALEEGRAVQATRPQVWVHAEQDIVFHLDERHFRAQSPCYRHTQARHLAQTEKRPTDSLKPWLIARYGLSPDFFSNTNIDRMARESTPTENLRRIVAEIQAAAASRHPA